MNNLIGGRDDMMGMDGWRDDMIGIDGIDGDEVSGMVG